MESNASILEYLLRTLTAEELAEALTLEQLTALPYTWEAFARPNQLPPPGDWLWWVAMAGRGFGKTRLGAEWVRMKARMMPGSLGALVGQTPEEVRRVQVEGPAGLLVVCPPGERPEWEPSNGTLVWPNGTRATVYSGANPEALRGPQHHWAWCDEFAKFKQARQALDHLTMGLRLVGPRGEEPQCCVTTTPRPIGALRDLISRRSARVVKGTTYDNRSNLAPTFLRELIDTYEGTRLGRQELGGELLDDVPGALWKRSWFEAPGFRRHIPGEELDLIAVAIDPAVSDTEESDETGIVASGCWQAGERRMFHVVADASLIGSPSERSRAAIKLYQHLDADVFVVEVNNGGDWIPAAIASEWTAMGLPGVPPVKVVHATRGKKVRAEPISALCEQGRVSHEPGLEALEDELVTWSATLGERSPNRLDAMVWAATWLSSAKQTVIV